MRSRARRSGRTRASSRAGRCWGPTSRSPPRRRQRRACSAWRSSSPANAFFYPGTIGVLSLLVAYIVTNLGAIRFLFIAARRAPIWQVVIPIVAIAFLGYTIYKNIKGTSFPYDRFPIVVAIWLIVGAAITVIFPRLTRSIGQSLARREGIATEEA
jgi:hypothetical protein